MSSRRIAVTVDEAWLAALDQMVVEERLRNRSEAIRAAVAATLRRRQRQRLARACLKLDPAEEIALAEEGLAEEAASWPEY